MSATRRFRPNWFRLFAAAFAVCVLIAPAARASDAPASRPARSGGMVVGTTSPAAVHAGVQVLREGGSAADAAAAVAVCQVVTAGGSYVSAAGICSVLYYDAASGRVYALDAGFNTPLEEHDPASIPRANSGRTALVPGFMAGVGAAHGRFGKLPLARVLGPAIAMCEEGVRVDPGLDYFIQQRKALLSRFPEAKRVFTDAEGQFYTEGDILRQPELAATLRGVAREGAAFMYTGAWGRHFVETVRRAGGRITDEDLRAYRPTWEEPARTTYRDWRLYSAGFSGAQGVNFIEAMNLAELADLKRLGPATTSPETFFWLNQILACQALSNMPPEETRRYAGLDLSPANRVKQETSAAIWERMRRGTWPMGNKFAGGADPAPHSEHTDAIVVADRWGNVAAVIHTINTNLWGETGLFVDGVSIPDPAAFQQRAAARAGPGHRLPATIGPVIVLGNDGKPVLACAGAGSGLHEKMVQAVLNVLDFNLRPQQAADAPYLLPYEVSHGLLHMQPGRLTARVRFGAFDAGLLDAVRKLGQPVKVFPYQNSEAASLRGYWVAIAIDPATGERRAGRPRELPSTAEED